MNKRKLTLPAIALLCSLLLVGGALAAATQAVDWSVIGGGGGHAESRDGGYTLDATIGQAVVGIANNLAADTELCAGFWCDGAAEAAQHIYLPVVQK